MLTYKTKLEALTPILNTTLEGKYPCTTGLCEGEGRARTNQLVFLNAMLTYKDKLEAMTQNHSTVLQG
jgi:hypothetical protein